MHSGSVPKQEVICAILNKNRNKKDKEYRLAKSDKI